MPGEKLGYEEKQLVQSPPDMCYCCTHSPVHPFEANVSHMDAFDSTVVALNFCLFSSKSPNAVNQSQ